MGTLVSIDPDVANKRAIRAYEKAGFRPLLVSRESLDGTDTPVLIMVQMPETARKTSETTP